ncbi:MAG TPA: spore germination protein [Candidatus Paenibacillus intestinavium]|nr:spore germination protein [Candidatus Paenibacillus intestinavium]
MIKAENKISQFQLFFLIMQTQIGIGIIYLPYEVNKISGSDAWISVFIAGMFVQIGILIIWLLCRRYPEQTIFEVMSMIVGKPIGFLLKVGYTSYFLLSAILITLQFGEKVNTWILPRTPIWVISFLLIAICIFCIKESLKVIARFFVVVSLLLVVLLAFTFLILRDIHILFVQPIGVNGVYKILKGASQGSFSFQGFESLLVILPYCLGKGVGKLKVALSASGFTIIFYTYLTFITITYFGTEALRFIPEPVLYIMKFKYLEIIDRVDLIFFSIWIVSVATSVMMFLYLASIGMTHLFGKTKRTPFVYCLGALTFIAVSLIPVNGQVIHTLGFTSNLYSIIFTFILPIILLIVSVVRRQKVQEDIPS